MNLKLVNSKQERGNSLFRHCERSEAIQSKTLILLDCFVACYASASQ
ncbi:MAG: hypothetical protein LBK53_01960 [Heliobacteriaceae bacterium]|nr:hypothetical protein [Heliobacteriaceae bacterium]